MINVWIKGARSVQFCIAPAGLNIRTTLVHLADERTAYITHPALVGHYNGVGVRCTLVSAHQTHKMNPAQFDRVIVDGRYMRGPKTRAKLEVFCEDKDVYVIFGTPDEALEVTSKIHKEH